MAFEKKNWRSEKSSTQPPWTKVDPGPVQSQDSKNSTARPPSPRLKLHDLPLIVATRMIELRKIHRSFGGVEPTRSSFFKDHRIQGLKFLSDSTLIDMNHVLIISVILFTSLSGQGYTFTRSHYAMK